MKSKTFSSEVEINNEADKIFGLSYSLFYWAWLMLIFIFIFFSLTTSIIYLYENGYLFLSFFLIKAFKLFVFVHLCLLITCILRLFWKTNELSKLRFEQRREKIKKEIREEILANIKNGRKK